MNVTAFLKIASKLQKGVSVEKALKGVARAALSKKQRDYIRLAEKYYKQINEIANEVENLSIKSVKDIFGLNLPDYSKTTNKLIAQLDKSVETTSPDRITEVFANELQKVFETLDIKFLGENRNSENFIKFVKEKFSLTDIIRIKREPNLMRLIEAYNYYTEGGAENSEQELLRITDYLRSKRGFDIE